jgi:hypothetical protein
MPSASNSNRRTAFGGLLVRREKWTLSALGILAALATVGVLLFAGVRELYPFLAITDPTASDTLVIDGWMPTYDLIRAAEEFRNGHYRYMVVVGAVYEFDRINGDPGNAEVIARVMVRAGVPRDRLSFALYPGLKKDRTFHSALAVGDWFRSRNLPLNSCTIATLGPHARRSRLLYQRALGRSVRIGVIALDDPAYDERQWWRFSDGIREVLFEGFAYVYVRCVFSSP